MRNLTNAAPKLAALTFLTFPVALGVANALILALLLAWLFSGRMREYWLAIRSNPVIVAALLLYGVVLFGVPYSTAPASDIVLHLNKYSKLLFIAIIFSVLSDEKWQRQCMRLFAAAMLFVLVSTWLNVWFVLPWSKTQTPGWGHSHHVIGDYITQNIMMSFFVLLCLIYAKGENWIGKRISWIVVALLAAISITHLSEGRTGYVLLTTALLVFPLCALKGKAFWSMLTIGVVGLSIAFMSSQVVMQRVEKAVAEYQQSETEIRTPIGHRLYNYKTTLKLISEKPVLGWGTGAYHNEICRAVAKSATCSEFAWHPHNQFLFFGADHGLLGIFAYIFLISTMIWLALKDQNLKSRTLLIGLAVLLAVNSLFNSSLWSARENHFFTYMIALLAARSGLSLRRHHISLHQPLFTNKQL